MMESNILKVLRVFLYSIIIILSIIILYHKFNTPQTDIYLRDFLNNFSKKSSDFIELREF